MFRVLTVLAVFLALCLGGCSQALEIKAKESMEWKVKTEAPASASLYVDGVLKCQASGPVPLKVEVKDCAKVGCLNPASPPGTIVNPPGPAEAPLPTVQPPDATDTGGEASQPQSRYDGPQDGGLNSRLRYKRLQRTALRDHSQPWDNRSFPRGRERPMTHPPGGAS